jgi:multiple sugar transport system substrate-binding protein
MMGNSPPRLARWARLATATTAAVALLAACSDGGSKTDAKDTGDLKPGQKIEMTFWSWVPGVDKAVDLWNSEHPNVQVKLEKIPAGSSGGYAKMFSALKAGTAPDLAQVEYQEIPGFLLQDGLVDLTKYGVANAKDKFVAWQWAQGAFGGAVYAVPQASGPMGMFYRQDLFSSWGVEPPQTWEQFEAAARKIHAADPTAYICAFPPGNSAWFTSLAWQAGARWFDVDGDNWKVKIDDPATLKVAEYWDRLRTEGVVKLEPDFANGWYKDLQDGKIPAWVSAQWGDAILTGNAPQTAGKWRVAPMPQWQAGENRSANWGGSSTAVLKGAKHPKQATEFAIWLNSDPKSIDLLVKGGYGWPAANDAFKGTTLNQPSDFFGGQRYNDVFADADKTIDKNWKWIPTVDATYQHLNDGFQNAVAGKGTFVDAVKNAQTQTVADMKAKGLKVVTSS